MGTSKTYRAGPGWEKRNTPGAAPKVSKGAIVHAEGTHMSGYDESGRKGLRKGTRQKSRSGGMSAKNPGIHEIGPSNRLVHKQPLEDPRRGGRVQQGEECKGVAVGRPNGIAILR